MRYAAAALLIATVGLVVFPGDVELGDPGPRLADEEIVRTLNEAGADVDVEAHLPDDGWTIVEFTAGW